MQVGFYPIWFSRNWSFFSSEHLTFRVDSLHISNELLTNILSSPELVPLEHFSLSVHPGSCKLCDRQLHTVDYLSVGCAPCGVLLRAKQVGECVAAEVEWKEGGAASSWQLVSEQQPSEWVLSCCCEARLESHYKARLASRPRGWMRL